MLDKEEQADRIPENSQVPDKITDSSPSALLSNPSVLKTGQQKANYRFRDALIPKRIMSGEEICSRFEQVSGKQIPKRMTTGKFVYIGPTDKLPDSPF